MSLSGPPRRSLLERLRRHIRGIEGRSEVHLAEPISGRGAGTGWVRSGWPGVDDLAGGLPRGVLNEWLGVGDEEGCAAPLRDRWTPPLLLLAHLAARALGERGHATGSPQTSAVVWIGQPVWPYAPALAAASGGLPGPTLLERTLFVDPPDLGSRLWAIDVALRCRALAAVVADASGLRMAESRRLQLAAEAGGAFALLTRPPCERSVPSVAATRWLVTRVAGGEPDAPAPAWSLRLLRSKVGARAGGEAPEPWRLEWDHAQGIVVQGVGWQRDGESARALPAELVGGPRSPASAHACRAG